MIKPAFNVPEFFLLTEEDFLPSPVVVKTRDQMSEEEYQAALRAEGCYDIGDDGKSFYDEE